MKSLLTLFIACTLLSCTAPVPQPPKTEVLVLGTVHGSHRTQPEFSLEILEDIVRTVNPDLILAEIPPDRFEAAVNGFAEQDTVLEPRVARFPEYVDVIFPLTKEMDFEIIPTAGWTRLMADERSAKLRAISQDPERADDWKRYTEANQETARLHNASGRRFDPYYINSDEYDNNAEIGLGVYNELFNVELGLGGWDNINKAHYWYINEALNEHKGEGKRVLITYGAGHKGWFLRELRKRDDIVLLNLQDVWEK